MSILAWLKRLMRRRLDDDDFQEEIRAHLAIAADERVADGADRQTARLASLKDFGNVTLTTEAARRVWTPWWLDAVHDYASDVRYAIRALAKHPTFSLTVIGVLTLSIGLNAAVFTMVKGLALSPLAGVDGSARLTVMFGETSTGRQSRVSYPDYRDLRDHVPAFADLFGSSLVAPNLGRGRNARQVWGELVTGNYFQALGVRAARGRTILPSDEVAPGRHPVIVLSDGLWRRDFGADPDMVGKTLELNNYALTVVGVADPTFHGTIVSYDVEVFIPVMMAAQMGVDGGLARTPSSSSSSSSASAASAATAASSASSSNVLTDRRAAVLFPHAFLRPGATLANAAAQTDALWATLARDRPLTDAAQRLRIVPFRQSPTGGQTYVLPTVTVLSAMGLLVLLIACANIAGLVLVRAMSRRGEIAVRLALGATRTRIVRLLILENLLLALPGAAFGLVLAWRGIPIFLNYADWLAAPQRLFLNLGVDGLVIAFAVLVACGSALVFGFAPALRSSRIDLVSVMRDVSPRGAARGRFRAGLVVAQVAVSLLLLVGAGLVTRSLDAARHANPGFDADHVTTIAIDVRQIGYDAARGRTFYRHLLDAMRADPGVDAASLAAFNPLGMVDTRAQRVAIDGYAPRRDEDLAFMSNTVGPDYFRTLRIPLVAGRAFEDRDDEAGGPVLVVNNTLAQRFWGDATSAIGKRVRVADGDWRTVIGVAADVKYSRINEAPRPYVYVPFFQSYRSGMIVYTRGPAPIDVLMEQARARIAALDADLPMPYARPLTERISGALVFFNLAASMLFLFGAAGMALAAMGTYGLVAYVARQRTHEIGIRMALGASSLSIVRVFLARGLTLGAIGAALGMAAALGVSRLLGSVLFGVSATDATSYTRALAVVLTGVIAATIVPAWRAARTDPLKALRHP
jgi:macrolide transport system ATP-binding/permease protein